MTIKHKNSFPIIAVVFNLIIIGLFFQALLFPLANAEWIFRGAMIVYMFEFFAIFAMVVPSKMMREIEKARRKGNNLIVGKEIVSAIISTIFFLGMVTVFGFALEQPLFILYFVASIAIKFFAHRKTGIDKREVIVSTVLMVLTPFIASLTSFIWIGLFPFPDAIFDYALEGSSGSLVDHPQILLGWGIIYFTLMTLYAIKADKINKLIPDESIKF
ncbi:MAG: hypothetical protein ABH846_00055 [Patescibacteria group bacterium]